MTRFAFPLLAAALLAPLPVLPAQAQDRAQVAPNRALHSQIGKRAPKDLRGFYAARGNAPLWFDETGRPLGAATILIYRLRTAGYDGLDPGKLGADKVPDLIDRARYGDADDKARAEVALSEAFVEYVRGMRTGPALPMSYESDALKPVAPTPAYALRLAAEAPSLEHYMADMGWMHPFYAPLRTAMEDPRYSEAQRKAIWTNLARLRALPSMAEGRFVLVDAAAARLWMYDGGKPIDSMKVVVGDADGPTPIMAGTIRYAIENPYWLVPDDIVQNELSAYVLKYGTGWVADRRYQVLDGWGEGAQVIDPKTVDWKGVNAGTVKVHMRQLPGGSNFMGRVKFEFPNPQGIYLHDTPAKHLMKESDRQLSHGCVRLEDANKMHKWLMGTPLPAKAGSVEHMVPLADPVPIYITYLTVQPGPAKAGNGAGAQNLAFLPDPYARDAQVRIAAN